MRQDTHDDAVIRLIDEYAFPNRNRREVKRPRFTLDDLLHAQLPGGVNYRNHEVAKSGGQVDCKASFSVRIGVSCHGT
jgi:hypothetical protein